MSQIFRTVSLVAVLVGIAWMIQAMGLKHVGLFSVSPTFLFLGAVIAGSGTGAIAGFIMSDGAVEAPAFRA